MSRLFEKSTLNGMELSNRFVRSATWLGLATDDGMVTPSLIHTMAELAKGGVGLIISGHAYVRPEGQASFRQIGIYKDHCIPGLRDMVEAVHDHGGNLIAQLAHAGNFAAEKLTGRPPFAVSNFEGLSKTPRKEISGKDADELVAAFADAAGRAKEAGFDGIQLHSAHGYLLSQFLSPYFNRRSDPYGGDIKNRTRMHVRILRAVRDRVGKNYPVLIKLNCSDFAEGGLSLPDSILAAEILFDEGLDAVEISGGLLTGGKLSPSRPGIHTVEKEAYFSQEARAFKSRLDRPLILVGGIRSFETAEKLVEEGTADYISMSRPLIREPGLIKRWKNGDRRKATCFSDNLCFRPGLTGKGVYCLSAERENNQAKDA